MSEASFTPTGHAVVTGGSSGMGLGIAEKLASEGMPTTLIGRTESRVAGEVERLTGLGYQVQGFAIDVRDAAAIARVYAQAAAPDGSLAVAVHAAGVVYAGSVSEADPAHLADTIDTNVLGVMYGSQQALRRMKEGGYIFNISSTSGREPSKVAAYCASKYAVTGFTECLRREVAPQRIRVTCLEPGLTYSDFNRNMPESFQTARKEVESMTRQDLGEVVWSMLMLPAHVNIGEAVFRPVSQVA